MALAVLGGGSVPRRMTALALAEERANAHSSHTKLEINTAMREVRRQMLTEKVTQPWYVAFLVNALSDDVLCVRESLLLLELV